MHLKIYRKHYGSYVVRVRDLFTKFMAGLKERQLGFEGGRNIL
jgi:hypothetical protein